jgi:leucyl aminopeptidase (aminopeptidase T)
MVIEQAGGGADIVAELGIGTNDQARLTGRIITDEKVLGTAHVAFGHNKGSYGGDNEATIHIDGVMADASIWVDGELAIERGTLVS